MESKEVNLTFYKNRGVKVSHMKNELLDVLGIVSLSLFCSFTLGFEYQQAKGKAERLYLVYL